MARCGLASAAAARGDGGREQGRDLHAEGGGEALQGVGAHVFPLAVLDLDEVLPMEPGTPCQLRTRQVATEAAEVVTDGGRGHAAVVHDWVRTRKGASAPHRVAAMDVAFAPVWNPGEIGKRIRRLREERGLKQHQLGVHRNTIAKLESGERGKKPGVSTLLKIARALDVPLHEITGSETGPVQDLDDAFAAYLQSREAGLGKPPEPEEIRYLKAHPHAAWVHSPPGPRSIFLALESLRDLEKWPEILASWVAANPDPDADDRPGS